MEEKSFLKPIAKKLKRRSVLVPKGTSIKTGNLYKRGGGHFSEGWKERFMNLTMDGIYYYKEKGDSEETGKKFRGFIALKGHKIEDHQDSVRPNAFKLVPTHGNRTWYLATSSQEEKNEWMDVIRRLLDGEKIDSSIVEFEEKLKRSNYQLVAEEIEDDVQIGRGANGIVCKGLWMKTTPIATKTLLNTAQEFVSDEERNQFLQEIQTLSTLRHPNIVSMFGYCNSGGKIKLVTEYIPGGDLSKYIYDKSIVFDWPLILDLALAICRGMNYLHKQKIIHRDLKPGNILVKHLETAQLTVCDFGLSKYAMATIDEEKEGKTFGSPAYAAPELSSKHDPKVDVYSFSIILWELCSRKPAWEGMKQWYIHENVSNKKRPPLEEWPVKNLIAQCWDHDPNRRPNFVDIYNDLEQIKLAVQLEGISLDLKFLDDPKMHPEEKINRLFTSKKDKVEWKEFSLNLVKILNARPEVIEPLRFVLVKYDLNYVEKKQWDRIMKWFSPLVVRDGYNKDSANPTPVDEEAWTIEDISTVLSPPWFFGFISQGNLREILLSKPQGTYLVRFSAKEPQFTLSVADETEVLHWRINPKKLASDILVLSIDNEKQFSSFYELIDWYKLHPLRTKVGQSIKTVFLKNSCDRENYLNVLDWDYQE